MIFLIFLYGEKRLYHWLERNSELIHDGKTGFTMIDVLNCENGCICGTAVDSTKAETDDALRELLKIKEKSKKTRKIVLGLGNLLLKRD